MKEFASGASTSSSRPTIAACVVVLVASALLSTATMASASGRFFRASTSSSAAAFAFRRAAGFPATLSQSPSPSRLVRLRPSSATATAGASTAASTRTFMVDSRASSTAATSNDEIVRRRLRMEREKREARERSVLRRTNRNLHIKRLLQESGGPELGDPAAVVQGGLRSVPPLYAVKVTVCDEMRRELELSGKEKRGRVFLEKGSDALSSFQALTRELYGFFRALRKDTFVLRASLPDVDADGTVSVASDGDVASWPVRTDDDVAAAFARADEFFRENSSLRRPSIVIHVDRNPDAPPPPPPPAYLRDMADPNQSPTMTMLSFYSFPPSGIADPDDFATMLRKTWKKFGALGRIYVAAEGVNAQMSVPTNVLGNFMECCKSIPELGEHMENGINVDPVPLTREEFSRAGASANDGSVAPGEPCPPFKNLHVRVRTKVVADGLDRSYDWQSAGYDMPPMEWHEQIKRARDATRGDSEGAGAAPVILDCRNTYETDIGIFQGAEPLNTENFRDSWTVLGERLKDLPKDAPIMTYCTGGIRCVKVGAYLTQELGFKNVSRLAGGIIAYDRTLKDQAPTEEPMFKGTNFVFDGRLGRPITEDSLGTCVTCGCETSLISNCRNENCHKRIIQCENCRTSFQGTCSAACKNRLVNGSMQPRRTAASTRSVDSGDDASSESSASRKYSTIEEYSSGHSSPLPSVYAELEHNTRALIPSGSHMVSGATQGRLLCQLASMTREGRVLELGTFTGYATACLLEGAANVGRVVAASSPGTKGSRAGGPYVLSMERDTKAFEVAVAHMKIVAEHGFGEVAAEKLCALRARGVQESHVDEDLVSLDHESGLARCELARVSDALAAVEEIAAGRGVRGSDDSDDGAAVAPFDMVFVDADKTRLIEYVDACLSSDRLLKKGGLVVVDNVLWKGLVLEASNGEFVSLISGDGDVDGEESHSQLRKNRRARKLANKMHRFNEAIVKDTRAEVLVLPLRDGLSVIRKK